jgi:hypothetical protein
MSTFAEIEELNRFAEARCANAGLCWNATHTPSNKTYSIWQTIEDRCDGGNTYGIFVEGRTPVKSKVLRVISDLGLEPLGENEP